MLNMNPTDKKITVRPIFFDFKQDYINDWFLNNKNLTLLINAISIFIPDAEKFFIDTTREAMPLVTNKELIKNMRALIGQEANHRIQHINFNNLLQLNGFNTEYIESENLNYFHHLGSQSLIKKLAACVVMECITDGLARYTFSLNIKKENLNEFLDFWIWHAVEETEHKSVLYELYVELGGTTRLLKLTIIKVGFYLLYNWLPPLLYLKSCESKLNFKTVFSTTIFFFRKKNLPSYVFKSLLAILFNKYNPWELNSSTEIEEWQYRYNAKLKNQKSEQS